MIWVGYAAASLGMKLLTWVLAPALAIVATWTGKLAGPLRYFTTHDDDVWGSRTTREPEPSGFTDRYLRALWWLYRNPAYGFEAEVCGLPAWETTAFKTGEYTWELFSGGRRYWTYKRDIRLSATRHVKIYLGWTWKPYGEYHKLKIDFHPFKRT